MDVYVIQIPKLQHSKTNRKNEQLKHPEYITTFVTLKGKKMYSSPVTVLKWPRGFHELKVPRFHDNGTGWW